MPEKKSQPKVRYERQRKSRETRRILAAITPETSHPQTQSPLFFVLPAEIRSFIFSLVLSESKDLNRPIHTHCTIYRPGYTHHSTFDLSLLRTCRLAYFESQAIPLRSATHHFDPDFQLLWRGSRELAIHHLVKQRGLDLYHLHAFLLDIDRRNLSRFLLPHLQWRRITWTLHAFQYCLTSTGQCQLDSLAYALTELTFPASCQEVTLEMEWREDILVDWGALVRSSARECQGISLQRSDGSRLGFDREYALQYKWVRSNPVQSGRDDVKLVELTMPTHTIRLCWRAKVARREYMSYDYVDCLNIDGYPGITKILPYDYDL